MSVETQTPVLFTYPERIKERLEATGDIIFKDGRRVTPSEVWRFMTEEAPARFPRAFDVGVSNTERVSEDVDFISGIKHSYITLTLRDRLDKAKSDGTPLVMIQGGQSMEPYFAAGALALRPAFVNWWARDLVDGQDVRQADFRSNGHLEQGRRAVSVDACHLVCSHQILQEGIVDVDLVAPYLCLRCSDTAYLTESHRGRARDIPRLMIDHPINSNADKEWSVDYVAAALRRLTAEISAITGRRVADDDLREEIVRHNKLRRLAREIAELWWAADVPPLNSADLGNIVGFGNEPWLDATAAISILEEAVQEVKDRIAKGVKGVGVAHDPARVFVCGSCVTANPFLVDRAGGAVVSHDDQWSETLVDVQVEGDPYVNLAKGILSYPYEQPSVERAEWTAEQVRKSRAEGLIFIYNWGCNYQSAVARLVADMVKEETGLPTVHLGSSELGRSEAVEQFQNRVEAFIEMLRLRKGFRHA